MCDRLFNIFLAIAAGRLRGRRWAEFDLGMLSLAIFAFTASAGGQPPIKDLSDASLEELSNIQVYSASKHLQNASDAPASITVVTSDEIQKYGYRNLADILRTVPGFYVTYDRDYSFVGVRGFGHLGEWNSRILLLIDGHRINNNVLGQAMSGNEFLVDVDMIERVEIVCGPSSSLYGGNAFFAVINVITRTTKQVRDWELSFQAGSFGTYEGRATYGHEFHGLGVLLSGTFYDSRARRYFSLNSTLRRTTTGLRATPTMKATSTFWRRLLFGDSRCMDCSAAGIRAFRRHISELYSMILGITTSTPINT